MAIWQVSTKALYGGLTRINQSTLRRSDRCQPKQKYEDCRLRKCDAPHFSYTQLHYVVSKSDCLVLTGWMTVSNESKRIWKEGVVGTTVTFSNCKQNYTAVHSGRNLLRFGGTCCLHLQGQTVLWHLFKKCRLRISARTVIIQSEVPFHFPH